VNRPLFIRTFQPAKPAQDLSPRLQTGAYVVPQVSRARLSGRKERPRDSLSPAEAGWQLGGRRFSPA